MTSVSFNQARTHLSELLDQVARGKRILITRHGKPAALLSPAPPPAAKDVRRLSAPRQFPPPLMDRVGQRPPKVQFQIEPGALRPGPKGDTVGCKGELGREGFDQSVSIDGSLAVHG
jgi:prevent-host-death family protein